MLEVLNTVGLLGILVVLIWIAWEFAIIGHSIKVQTSYVLRLDKKDDARVRREVLFFEDFLKHQKKEEEQDASEEIAYEVEG